VKILLTGGLRYIGSDTAVVLFQAGCELVLLDNFLTVAPRFWGAFRKSSAIHCPVLRQM